LFSLTNVIDINNIIVASLALRGPPPGKITEISLKWRKLHHHESASQQIEASACQHCKIISSFGTTKADDMEQNSPMGVLSLDEAEAYILLTRQAE
jgi:hypothetical protein